MKGIIKLSSVSLRKKGIYEIIYIVVSVHYNEIERSGNLKSIKLVTIGGGSSYTPELVEGMILRQSKLQISEWWFVDVELGQDKLTTIVELAKRMVKKAGLNWQIYGTLNRREALKDADFVTSQFRVGQLDARILDESIPLKYGMLGQETNGAGGIFKAFRTIEAYKPIIEDMKELCPDAWLINFTNPAGIVTEALINRLGWGKTIGVCNIPIGQQKAAAEVLDLDDKQLMLRHVGLNHFHFHEVWDQDGHNRTDEVIEKLYGTEREDKVKGVKNITSLDFPIELLRSLHLLPCDYHRYFFIETEMLEDSIQQFKEGTARGEQVKKIEEDLFAVYRNPHTDEKPKQLELRGGAYYSDIACQLIVAIVNDTHEQFTVSTVNQGVIDYLPKDCVVEISTIITANGPIPLAVPTVSPFVKGYLQMMKQMELLTVEAAMTGSYDLALQAFMIHPLIANDARTQVVLNELLLAHEPYLPQFHDSIEKIKIKE